MAKKGAKKGPKEPVKASKEDIVVPEPDEYERNLEKLVFGDEAGFDEGLKKADDLFNDNLFSYDSESSNSEESGSENEMSKLNDDQLFMVDSDGSEAGSEAEMDVDESSESDWSSSDSDAWHDSEEEKLQVSVMSASRLRKLRKDESEDKLGGTQYIARLRAQFERIYPRPEWADEYETQEMSDSDSEYDAVGEKATENVAVSSNPLLEYLRSNQTYQLSDKHRLLMPDRIDIARLTDANIKKPSHSVVQTVSFHPTHPLLLTGGFDRTLRVFHIDGKHNNMVTSLYMRNFPVKHAAFVQSDNGTDIFAGSRRRYMYKWSVNASRIEKINRLYGHEKNQRSFEHFKLSLDGKYIALVGRSGWINMLSAVTGQWVRGFKVEGELVDFDFSRSLIIAINKAGEVWEFDIQTGDIKSRWTDRCGVGITTIRLGGDRWLAVGSNTGVVNVYDRLKNELVGTVENLVTSITSLEFNHDSQLLCIASKDKKDALKLVHIPTCRVYRNWPTSGTPLGKVTSVCFSPTSEMLATGNEAGKVRLWRLNHY